MDMSFEAKEKLLNKAEDVNFETSNEVEPQLFQGTVAADYGWWLGKCFFTWVYPLIDFARKHKKLKIP